VGALSALWVHAGQEFESETTGKYPIDQTKTIDLMPYYSNGQIATGDSVWLRWHMVGGPNHDSGENVTFDAGSESTVHYTISGGVLNPSFDRQEGGPDPRGSKVSCTNCGGFVGALSALWNHAGQEFESETTDKYPVDQTKAIDLKPYHSKGQIATGDSVWLRWHMVGGPNHDSGENVTFDENSDANVNYTITGGVDNPRFHQMD
jgi:hypothetical protein